jgi:hypothetical protein
MANEKLVKLKKLLEMSARDRSVEGVFEIFGKICEEIKYSEIARCECSEYDECNKTARDLTTGISGNRLIKPRIYCMNCGSKRFMRGADKGLVLSFAIEEYGKGLNGKDLKGENLNGKTLNGAEYVFSGALTNVYGYGEAWEAEDPKDLVVNPRCFREKLKVTGMFVRSFTVSKLATI